MDRAGAAAEVCDPRVLFPLDAVYAEIGERAEFLRVLMGKPMVKTLTYSVADLDVYTLAGVPATAKWVPTEGQIWRHYKGPDEVRRVVAQGQIASGIVPYVIVNPGLSREIYADLSGVFLTRPGVSPKAVGLEAGANSYVDFTLDSGKISAVLEIEPGILLVPGNKAYPDWLVQKFHRRIAEPSTMLGPDEAKLFEAWNQAGRNPGTPVPIRILRYSVQGTVTEIPAVAPR